MFSRINVPGHLIIDKVLYNFGEISWLFVLAAMFFDGVHCLLLVAWSSETYVYDQYL